MEQVQEQLMNKMISKCDFGKLPSGEVVTLYKLKNTSGCEVNVIDYGCTIVRCVVPDVHEKPQDVALGFERLENYLDSSVNPYYGCVVGRVANRSVMSIVVIGYFLGLERVGW